MSLDEEETAMTGPTSITELNHKKLLAPIPGKTYWNSVREWCEEFIDFLLVDRFHDDCNRAPVKTSARSNSSGTSKQLSKFCGVF